MRKKNKDLTDKQILAMAKEPEKITKVYFKDYAVKYVNLGLGNRTVEMMRKELPAIAKRGAGLVMNTILKEVKMPARLPKHQQPFITVIIYAGVLDELDGEKNFIYPNPMAEEGIREV